MRNIEKIDIGQQLIRLLDEKNPIDEDIGIVDHSGDVCGVIISKEAYDFFLKKIEEAEDQEDEKTVEEFRKSGEKNQ